MKMTPAMKKAVNRAAFTRAHQSYPQHRRDIEQEAQELLRKGALPVAVLDWLEHGAEVPWHPDRRASTAP
jgi:hypothetical protein